MEAPQQRLKENIEKLLSVICIFQILSIVISLSKSVVSELFFFNKNNFSISIFLISLLVVGLAIFLAYTNFHLLIRKEKNRKFINFNKWINFLQVIELSVFGFTFYLVIGLQVMPYFSFKEDIRLLWEIHSFHISSSIFFRTGVSDIEVGINLIQLILFLTWDYISRKYFSLFSVHPKLQN
jgi:hypothetical protein